MVTPKSVVNKNEGETFLAQCRVIIVYGDDIVFYKDNRIVMTKNNNRTNITMTQDEHFRYITVVIRNLTLNDSGTYQCGKKGVLTNDYDAVISLRIKGEAPGLYLSLFLNFFDVVNQGLISRKFIPKNFEAKCKDKYIYLPNINKFCGWLFETKLISVQDSLF